MLSIKIPETVDYDERSVIMNDAENVDILAQQMFGIIRKKYLKDNYNLNLYIEVINTNEFVYKIRDELESKNYVLMHVYLNLKFIPSLKGKYGNLSFKDKLYILVDRVVEKIGLNPEEVIK
ncbi:MAG: hypothetical protein [Caudoviricetes sp.]|nr:MAG: hypothetical protein [Caudoviricetes sp.]